MSHSTTNGSSSFDKLGAAGLPLFPMLISTWFLLPEHLKLISFSKSDFQRSRTTHTTSTQSSLLEQHSSPSIQSELEDSNISSLHLDTDLLLINIRGSRRCWESHASPPFSSPSSPHQCPNFHTYASHFLSTLTMVPNSWPCLLSYINKFSIN